MILDASSLLAIILKEDGFEQLREKIDHADCLKISAGTLLEAAAALIRGEGHLDSSVLGQFLGALQVKLCRSLSRRLALR